MAQAYAPRLSLVTQLAAVAAAPLHAWCMWQVMMILGVVTPGHNWNYFGGSSQADVLLAVVLAVAAGLAGARFHAIDSDGIAMSLARWVWFAVWAISIPLVAMLVFIGAMMTFATVTRFGFTFDALVGTIPALAAITAVGIPVLPMLLD